MFDLKIIGIIGISTCLFSILYNIIPLLQVLLCCNVGQERFFKRLVTLVERFEVCIITLTVIKFKLCYQQVKVTRASPYIASVCII